MSASWSRRSSFRRAGVAVGLALVLVACSADEPEAGRAPSVAVSDTMPAPDPETRPDPVTEPKSDIRPAIEPDVPSMVAVEEAPDATIFGDVEVAVVQRLPRLELRWTDVELDVPQDRQWGTRLMYAGFNADDMLVIGQSTSTSGQQTLSTWRSTDGETWDRSDQPLETDVWLDSVFARGEQLVAVGNRQHQEGPELVILGTDPEGVWQPIDLGDAINTFGLISWLHASNDEGLVLIADRVDTEANRYPPLTIDIWDHQLVLDEAAGTYELIDRRSGDVTSSGSTSEIYPWNEDGQAVWRLDTRELLTVVPWEVWQAGWPTGSPLPIPVPYSVETLPTIEWDGYRIVIDDASNRIDVIDLTTTEVIASVGREEFYRGPAPQFRDDTSGDLVWSPTWAEWDQLMQAAWENQVDPPVGAAPQRVVLTSPDGIAWTEVDVDFGTADDSYVESIWSVAGEYQLVVNRWADGPSRDLYSSSDGVEWTSIDLDGDRTMSGPPTAGDGGIIAVSTSETGYGAPTLTTSTDGVTWTPEFQLGEQDDARHAWFELLASGSGGRVAAATLVAQQPPEPLTITIDDRTARFGDGEPAFTITDANGDVLLEADWHALELATNGERDPIVTYDDGVTTFWSPDGSPVMRIPDEAVYATYDQQDEAHLAGTDRVLFLERDGTWFEADVPLMGGYSIQLLAIGDESVLVAAGQWGEPGFECCEGEMDGGMTSLRVLVGDLDAAR